MEMIFGKLNKQTNFNITILIINLILFLLLLFAVISFYKTDCAKDNKELIIKYNELVKKYNNNQILTGGDDFIDYRMVNFTLKGGVFDEN